jgi:methionyl-tRNA formyltransferase
MLRTIMMGTPDFAVPTLQTLAASEHVVAVFTQPDRPAGRGRQVEALPVKREAVARGIPVIQPRSFRKQSEVIEELRALKPDVIVVAAYGLILPPAVLDIPAHGCLNVHASLLPKYRGASPIPFAMLNGERETGITIMLMDAGMDTGPILTQQSIAIAPDDDAERLERKLSLLGATLLGETLPRWIAGDITPQAQDAVLATYTRLITKQDGQIHWAEPGEHIVRMIRAYAPWPGAYTTWRGQPLRIIEAHASAQPGVPGTVSVRDNQMLIGTGYGSIQVERLQLAGKRAMNADEFLRGQRNFDGAQLGAPQ